MKHTPIIRSWRAAGCAALSVAVLAGCGSSTKATPDTNASNPTTNSASIGTNTRAEVTTASAAVAPFLKPSTSINIATPLKTAPPKGIKVAWLQGNLSTIQVITPGFTAATKALGWKLVIISYDPSNPQTANAAMQEAVNQKVNFIAISGLQSGSFASALANAQAAHIPVVEMDDQNEVDQSTKGILACIGCDSMVSQWGRLLGNWIIADSNANAHIVYDTIPDFAVLTPQGTALKATVTKGCKTCTVSVYNESVASLSAGHIASDLGAYLQSHAEINYVYFAFGSMADGVRSALTAANIGNNVKFVAGDPDISNAQDIIDGKMSAAVLEPVQGMAWVAVDAMARQSEQMPSTVSESAPVPTPIWTTANIPKPAQLYQGPVSYQQSFEKLWQVAQ